MGMKKYFRSALALSIALAGLSCAAATIPANAQMTRYGPPPAWAAPYYDTTSHVLTGTIVNSAPYRITVRVGERRRGLPIDLKNGTVINPVGTRLVAGQNVRIRGYWSQGTFIANRVRVL
jgi:hypothetical protein